MPPSGHELDPTSWNTDAALAKAVVDVARLERQIDLLWRESMAWEQAELSDQLAGVSHVLRHATSLLRGDGSIG